MSTSLATGEAAAALPAQTRVGWETQTELFPEQRSLHSCPVRLLSALIPDLDHITSNTELLWDLLLVVIKWLVPVVMC